MRSRSRSTTRPDKASKCDVNTSVIDNKICYEGESLANLLKLIEREIDFARNLDSTLPEKVWLKQQFSVGVNEVTRLLERMHPISSASCSPQRQVIRSSHNDKSPKEQLQAILLACDCNPRWLSKHLPSLASSRGVPLIFVKDKKGGSLRLGELLKLKTAITLGIKARGNAINQLLEKVLSNEIHPGTTESTGLLLT